MKKWGALFLFLICSCSSFAKDLEPKTFLAIFKAKELKELKTSLKQIESQFSEVFKTKTYSGNSELALLIEIPSCDFDECFLGEFLVNLEGDQKVQLQNIAFRLFDLTENKELHQAYMALYEDGLSKKKKEVKSARQTSGQLGGPGH